LEEISNTNVVDNLVQGIFNFTKRYEDNQEVLSDASDHEDQN
jgi:hypothetical protein